MKRLRSSDDLDSYNKDSSNNNNNPNRSATSSSSHRSSFYYNKADANARKSRDRSIDDSRKRLDHDFDSFDRRKGFDRYGNRVGGGGEGYSSGGNERGIYRSESFCGVRREFPKGFRSERERSRRDDSSWRRFKDFDDISCAGGGRVGAERAKGLREGRDVAVKSPSWSRDSGSEQTRSRGDGEGKEKEKQKDRKLKFKSSPTCSKDSGSEQSKSVEVKKSARSEKRENKSERSGRSHSKRERTERSEKSFENVPSNEMEEGELEPEPELETEPEPASKQEIEAGNKPQSESRNGDLVKENFEVDADHRMAEVADSVMEEVHNNACKQAAARKEDAERTDMEKEVGGLQDSEEGVLDSSSGTEDDVEAVGSGDEVDMMGVDCQNSDAKEAVSDKEKPLNLEEQHKLGKGIDLEANVEESAEGPEMNKQALEGNKNGANEAKLDIALESLSQSVKDKGKSVAVSPSHVTDSLRDDISVAVSPSHVTDSLRDGIWIASETTNLAGSRDNYMEGPSTRGFELFSTSPVRRSEKPEQSSGSKQKDETLSFEPLDLSLSLPNVLLPIGGAKETVTAPGSPSQARSIQSLTNTFRTNSDGYTASMSFSGSQSFHHNPSCSLTHNSLDFEQSVHSRPIFGGIDWQAQSQNDSRNKEKEIPLYQRILMNGNGSLNQSQAFEGSISNGQPLHQPVRRPRAQEGSSKMPNGLERQLSFHKNDVRSPSHSVGSHDMGSNYSLEKKRAAREKHSVSLYRSSSLKEKEQFQIGGADFVETVIGRIISEPIHSMARKFHEMTAQSISCLKESISEIMLNAEKHGQLRLIQNALQNRSDVTIDLLLKAHRSQLEILAALRTGILDFLQVDNSISTSDLAEIFLNLRCRNLTCRTPLPVDECDCKICVKKNGFCSACMCQVCSKFDMASNTCSWVGCDVCLHWCHADCGLRESFIRNGRSANGDLGTTEMQFHCVACDHPSEMFGFVKEVCQNFAKDWTAETFARELEYVKRIFSASKDMRGKRLHELADQLLARLANKSNLSEVYNHIMGFLTDSESSKFSKASSVPRKEGKEDGKSINRTAGPSQDTAWFKSSYAEKPSPLERSASLLPSFQSDRGDKHHLESELLRGSPPKEPLFEELESIVRIKQAEATMFQSRADDARREAEGLKRIAIAKNEKIEEEYSSRIAKLRLVEAEEMRKQKLEELQALERAHREYYNMKMRMEGDIKDLVLKMEATKRNLTM